MVLKLTPTSVNTLVRSVVWFSVVDNLSVEHSHSVMLLSCSVVERCRTPHGQSLRR